MYCLFLILIAFTSLIGCNKSDGGVAPKIEQELFALYMDTAPTNELSTEVDFCLLPSDSNYCIASVKHYWSGSSTSSHVTCKFILFKDKDIIGYWNYNPLNPKIAKCYVEGTLFYAQYDDQNLCIDLEGDVNKHKNVMFFHEYNKSIPRKNSPDG